MEIKSVSNLDFNGLSITKPVAETIKQIYQTELKRSDLMYNSKLAVKYAKKIGHKHLHDEPLFQRCFSNAWDKLDACDAVMLDYSLSSTKALAMKKRGSGIVADVFVINDGSKIKTSSNHLNNEHEFFGFFYNEFFRMLKSKK